MKIKKSKTFNYLVVWDMLGLEAIFNVDVALKEVEDYEKEKVWHTLIGQNTNKTAPNPIPLKFLLLRARTNSHRCYEIYTFSSSLNEKDIREQFTVDPQPIVNWIRENGNKIYSDYQTRKVIT